MAVESSQLDEVSWREIRKWARAGDANSQVLLSFAPLSPRTKKKWLLAAAAQDHPEACYLLYQLKCDIDWLRKAAELGWPPAQAGLGCHFAWIPDMVQSRHWYMQAALQGEASAMYEIGFTLLLGEGGPADPVQALEWLEKSAAADSHTYSDDVRRLLAQLYSEGRSGIPRDPGRAAYWEEQAHTHAIEDALPELIDHLYEHGLEGFRDLQDTYYLGRILVEYVQGSPEPEIVKELLRRGANPNVPLRLPDAFQGSTPLSWSTGNLEILDLLLSAGATVPKELSQKIIISVHETCQTGRLEALKMLMERADGRAALTFFDDNHSTPLIWAASWGYLEIVEYLLGIGADPCDCRFDSALDLAIKNHHTEVARLLRQAGAESLWDWIPLSGSPLD